MAKIIIDNKVRHGRPIITGTRITVDDVLGWLESGMTYEEIEREHKITKEDILVVIHYTSSIVRSEELVEKAVA